MPHRAGLRDAKKLVVFEVATASRDFDAVVVVVLLLPLLALLVVATLDDKR